MPDATISIASAEAADKGFSAMGLRPTTKNTQVQPIRSASLKEGAVAR